MTQSNLIEVRITESDLAEIDAAIGTLKAKLLPQLQTLTVQDRLELPKMGDKTVAFVQKANDYARKNASFVPAFLDVAAMGVDLTAVQKLRELSRDLTPIKEALDDSITLSGSEAYQAALIFYQNIKMAAKNNISGAAPIYDDLSARFPGYPKNKEKKG